MSLKKILLYQKLAGLFLLLSLLIPQFVSAQYAEYEVKARFLETFTQFIDWPEHNALSDTTQSFVIGVLGENPFDNYLDVFYKKFKIKNRKVEIKYFSDLAQITECDLLYISASERKSLLSILSHINEKPILTVSDTKGFAKEGVHLNLFNTKNNTHFEINQSGLVKSGFSVWAQLYNYGKIVNPVKE